MLPPSTPIAAPPCPSARFTFALLPLALFIKPPQVPWKWVVLYGLFQGVGQFGILFIALKIGMTAALASVLLRERASRPLQAGMVLAALGLACFGTNYASPGAASGTTVAGIALLVAALACVMLGGRFIPFSDQSEIRREAAGSAAARQGEATTYRFDLEMESGATEYDAALTQAGACGSV